MEIMQALWDEEPMESGPPSVISILSEEVCEAMRSWGQQ